MNSEASRLRKLLFAPAARYPADPRAVFMLAFSVLFGLVSFALDAAPATLNSLLPHWVVLIWGILLVGGSIITLIGMAFQGPNGIITEQIGSAWVAATTLFYSGIALYIVGIDGLTTIGIIIAWGLSCVLRYLQLQALISQGIAKAAVNQAVRKG